MVLTPFQDSTHMYLEFRPDLWNYYESIFLKYQNLKNFTTFKTWSELKTEIKKYRFRGLRSQDQHTEVAHRQIGVDIFIQFAL